jgi:integrase
LVRLRVVDVTQANQVARRAIIMQRKTKRPVQFEITDQARSAVGGWIRFKGLEAHDYLFPSRKNPTTHISTRQFAKLLKRWVADVGLDPKCYGTHSLRRTKATLISGRSNSYMAIQRWRAPSAIWGLN